MRGIIHLLENGRDDLPPSGQQIGVGFRAIAFHHFMKFWQGMIRNQGEHVMLDMVVHVPIKEAVHRIHQDRPTIQAVIEDVLGEPGVLGQPVDQHQPRPEEMRQTDEHQRQNTARPDRQCDGGQINEQVAPRPQEYFGKLALWDELLLVFRHRSEGMHQQSTKVSRIGRQAEGRLDQAIDVRRAGDCDFGITTHDDGVTVVAVVAPAPDGGFPHHHE